MTPRPPSEMADDDLRAELAGLAGLSVAVIERGAVLYAEAARRGLEPAVRWAMLRGLLPAVAAGTLSARAVVRFADLGRLFRAVRQLPLAEQDRLAAGGTIDVSVSGDVLPLTARELWPAFVRQVFQVAGRVATVEEQAAYAAAERAGAEARRERAITRTVRRLERQQVSTVGQAVELMVAFGFRPEGR